MSTKFPGDADAVGMETTENINFLLVSLCFIKFSSAAPFGVHNLYTMRA
jgi:hypothetical protein